MINSSRLVDLDMDTMFRIGQAVLAAHPSSVPAVVKDVSVQWPEAEVNEKLIEGVMVCGIVMFLKAMQGLQQAKE